MTCSHAVSDRHFRTQRAPKDDMTVRLGNVTRGKAYPMAKDSLPSRRRQVAVNSQESESGVGLLSGRRRPESLVGLLCNRQPSCAC